MTLGASFVVPVHNGERYLREALEAILAQADGRPFEVIAVDDGSTDRSGEILSELEAQGRIRVIAGPRLGAAAAVNAGVAAARYDAICQVDQDVVLQPGWMSTLLSELESDSDVAAAQGYYVTDRSDGLWARASGYDLELRYLRLARASKADVVYVDHVCSGNSAYRRADFMASQGFDAAFGYGYDNDLSYRLVRGGHRLAFCPSARAVHHWRTTARAYLRQQFGVGYGRLDLVRRHREKLAGDQVSDWRMIAHVPATLGAIGCLGSAGLLAALGGPAQPMLVAAGALVGATVLERGVTAVAAARHFNDPMALFLVPAHLLRNLAWCWASALWVVRRLQGRPQRPAESM